MGLFDSTLPHNGREYKNGRGADGRGYCFMAAALREDGSPLFSPGRRRNVEFPCAFSENGL